MAASIRLSQDPQVSLASSLCFIFYISHLAAIAISTSRIYLGSVHLSPSPQCDLSCYHHIEHNGLCLASHPLLFSYNSINLVVKDPQKMQIRCFLFIIFHNSHNSIKHLVFGQCLFLALPSSDPISDAASMFCMFRSWSHVSFSDSSHCSRILSAWVCWVNGVMLGVRLAKVSLLEKVFYFLNNYLTDLRELAAGDKGSLAVFPSINNPKLELLAGWLAM